MKKIISLVMAAIMVMALGVTAFAADVNDASGNVTGQCNFYRYKNNAWSLVPYGMDDGNITNAVLNDDGSITLYFDYATYSVMGFIPVTGGIAEVTGEGVVDPGVDLDGDYCLDYVTVMPNTDIEILICEDDGNTDIGYGMMDNPIEVQLWYTASAE